MKHGEVDQGIGGQEEVGDDGGDDVQLRCTDKGASHRGSHGLPLEGSCPTDEDEGEGNPKSQDVASEGLVVLSITFGKDAQTGVDVVLAQSLR